MSEFARTRIGLRGKNQVQCYHFEKGQLARNMQRRSKTTGIMHEINFDSTDSHDWVHPGRRVLALVARHFGSLDWIVENESRLRQLVRQQPWQAVLVGLAIYTTFSLVPGTVGKSVVCGWVFGFWLASLIVDIGLTIAAVASFLAARHIFRDTVTARLGGLVRKMDRALDHDGTFYLLMMRLAHVPFSVVNYGAGATHVTVGKFAWTTAVGILPGSMVFVFVGTAHSHVG